MPCECVPRWGAREAGGVGWGGESHDAAAVRGDDVPLERLRRHDRVLLVVPDEVHLVRPVLHVQPQHAPDKQSRTPAQVEVVGWGGVAFTPRASVMRGSVRVTPGPRGGSLLAIFSRKALIAAPHQRERARRTPDGPRVSAGVTACGARPVVADCCERGIVRVGREGSPSKGTRPWRRLAVPEEYDIPLSGLL
eukprot:COSAG04_NODE_1047_length_8562_cov_9.403167_5_plen_193_part_00